MQYIADFIMEMLDSIYAHLPADADLPEIDMTLPEPLVSDVFTRTYTFTAVTIVPSVNTDWSAVFFANDEGYNFLSNHSC
ncbi:MAG: hypothetical protein A2Y87_06160 [Bacteroidetes bacterium RBG_13_46_8]|nr:MAG: hypothetical protein A2Y87_06160 [Bacteroidetes bacterium RBG_13_46_8]